MTEIENEYSRHFKSQLIDSIILLEEIEDARKDNDHEFADTLCRASIMSSLLLETAANTCIEFMDLDKQFFLEVDRLPITTKFDFFLRTRFRDRKLDRSKHQFQILKELISVRNMFVHPKTKYITWNVERFDDDTATLSTDLDKTNLLKVAMNPDFWDTEDALSVMHGVHIFLKFFFHDMCKFNPKQVSSLLFARYKVPTLDFDVYEAISKEVKTFLLDRSIDISYVRIRWS